MSVKHKKKKLYYVFLISDFRRDLNIEYVLLGISPASNCSRPTFRNPVSVPSSKADGRHSLFFIMFIIVLGQHVSILIESSSGPSKIIDPYLENV